MNIEKEIYSIEKEAFFTEKVPVVCDPRIKAHCLDPYHDHPKGCPNWNHKEGCPPHVPYYPEIYQPNAYLAVVKFAFGEYLSQKRLTHPDWTERALRNPRHWQGHVRSQFNQFLENELPKRSDIEGDVILNPEALGVNVFATCANAGLTLEHTPTEFVYKIALIARPNLLK